MKQKICKCYRIDHYTTYDEINSKWKKVPVSCCYGTADRSVCSCEGDETKCDYYPEKRFKALLQATQVEDKHHDRYVEGYKDGYDAAMKAVWELVGKHLDRTV